MRERLLILAASVLVAAGAWWQMVYLSRNPGRPGVERSSRTFHLWLARFALGMVLLVAVLLLMSLLNL